MIYLIMSELEGICSLSGYVDEDKDAVVAHAVEMAKLALDYLDDAVTFSEWYDLSSAEADPRVLLKSRNEKERLNIISQISDNLKGDNRGCLDFYEFPDVFALIAHHEVETWCSDELRRAIDDCRRSFAGLVRLLNEEWQP
jgi:hypothetical protein